MSTPKTKKPPMFGQLAVARGYCTAADVDRALKIQKDEDQQGEKHRLIGIIMIAEGLLSTTQLIELLKAYEQKPAGRPA